MCVCLCITPITPNYWANGHQTWHMDKVRPHGEHGLLCFICSTGLWEGRSTKIIYANAVYHVAPPGGGGRGYYKSAVEITCIFALYTSPESAKPQSQPPLIRGGRREEAVGRGGMRKGKGRVKGPCVAQQRWALLLVYIYTQ